MPDQPGARCRAVISPTPTDLGLTAVQLFPELLELADRFAFEAAVRQFLEAVGEAGF
jgi:hypothetical protein